MYQRYQSFAYGLHIHSTIPLPELESAPGQPDVLIREEPIEPPPLERFCDGRFVEASETEAHLSWLGVGSFHVRDGREIAFCPHAAVAPAWLRQFILGPVMGVLLHQRGLLVLHASAVEVGGRALLFVGRKGAGKSTTAAHLYRRGHRLIADDIVAVDTSVSSVPRVIPGIRQLKLWPDAVSSLDLSAGALTMLNEALPKRAWQTDGDVVASAWPIERVYALRVGDRIAIDEMPGQDGFGEIVRNVYAARFIGRAGIPPRHFHQCVAVARAVRVYRFTRRPSLPELPAALDFLEARLADEASDA